MQPVIQENPAAEQKQVIWDGVRTHNEPFAASGEDISFGVFLRAPDGSIRGGLLARAGRGWLHINTVWVDPNLRGQGFGRELVRAAEGRAISAGCHSAYLDTFSFQARPFYEKCGYEVFGILEDFPEGHRRYFMRKKLTPAARPVQVHGTETGPGS